MKPAVVCAICLVIVACVDPYKKIKDGITQEMHSWVGKPLTQVEATYGQPAEVWPVNAEVSLGGHVVYADEAVVFLDSVTIPVSVPVGIVPAPAPNLYLAQNPVEAYNNAYNAARAGAPVYASVPVQKGVRKIFYVRSGVVVGWQLKPNG